MTDAEARGLIAKAQAGDRSAEAALAEGWAPLVYKTAGHYYAASLKCGVRFASLGDIAQEGFIGLLRAIREFDLSKPNKFITFAAWAIRGRCQTGAGLDRVKDKAKAGYPRLVQDVEREPMLPEIPAPEPPPERDWSAVLGILTKRERRAVSLYYGLDGSPALGDFTEVAEAEGYSFQRAQQLVKSAVAKLKEWYGDRPPESLAA